MVETSATDAALIEQIERMQQVLAANGYGDLGMWNELCRKHVHLLRTRGFANFKRTINFEYHQWSVRSFVDFKLLKIAATLLWRGQLPRTALSSRLDHDDASDVQWTKADATRSRLAAYRLYVSLLWDLVATEDHLKLLEKFAEPELGRPLSIRSNGTLISQDLALSALEVNDIARRCDLSSLRRVAEIGAGYGRVAWLFMRSAPQVAYHIFDIPPALAVSQNYLAACLGSDHVVPCPELDGAGVSGDVFAKERAGSASFHLPLNLDRVPERSFDLVINISSFDEMPDDEVNKYFAWIDRTLAGHLYLKGYKYNPASGRSYRSFPYGKSWKRIWSRTDPTNPVFVEQMFVVNKP